MRRSQFENHLMFFAEINRLPGASAFEGSRRAVGDRNRWKVGVPDRARSLILFGIPHSLVINVSCPRCHQKS